MCTPFSQDEIELPKVKIVSPSVIEGEMILTFVLRFWKDNLYSINCISLIHSLELQLSMDVKVYASTRAFIVTCVLIVLLLNLPVGILVLPS